MHRQDRNLTALHLRQAGHFSFIKHLKNNQYIKTKKQ